MGDAPTEPNTALAHPLYASLGWQTLLLAVLTAVISVWVLAIRRRAGAGRPADQPDQRPEPAGRRTLRIGLGVLWIVDGLLQAQPQMPASFVPHVLGPSLAAAPGWLYELADPFARIWAQHPVPADAVSVWVQVGLGVALLVGGTGRLGRLALVTSAGWAAFVWLVGEALGGLTDPNASWLTGAPGAALLYLVASLLLLLPESAWDSGAAALWARRSVGGTFALGAVLQALPRGGYWLPSGLSGVFSDVATMGVPAPLTAPVRWAATTVGRNTPPYGVLANALLVAVLALLGAALLLNVRPRQVGAAAAVLCGFGWWFGQGFGVFGGLGTDPNTGVVLLLLLAAGWPRVAASPAPAAQAVPADATSPLTAVRARAAAAALAVSSIVLLPLVAGVGLLGPQTAQAAVGDSGGMLRTLPTPAPDFTLTDQDGQPIGPRDLHGKLVLIAFLDPECFDACPVLAAQLASAMRALGGDAGSVAILAVDVNPEFNRVDDVRTFTQEHGLQDLASWHFVTGSNAQVGAVLAEFGEGVTVPRVGMIGHPQNVYLYGRDGRRLAVLADTANEDLTESYSQLLSAELRQHL